VDVNDDQYITPLDGQDDWASLQIRTGSMFTHLAPPRGYAEASISVREADAIPLVPVTGVVATTAETGVAVRWSPMRLQRVVAFQVFRSVDAGSPEPIAIVENAAGFPSFIDRNPPRGALAYTVIALYTPHARSPEQPPEVLHGGQWIASPAFIDAVEQSAPVSTARLERFRTGTALATRRFSPVIRTTRPSAPAAIVVQ
jgi:hypothetical protein